MKKVTEKEFREGLESYHIEITKRPEIIEYEDNSGLIIGLVIAGTTAKETFYYLLA